MIVVAFISIHVTMPHMRAKQTTRQWRVQSISLSSCASKLTYCSSRQSFVVVTLKFRRDKECRRCMMRQGRDDGRARQRTLASTKQADRPLNHQHFKHGWNETYTGHECTTSPTGFDSNLIKLRKWCVLSISKLQSCVRTDIEPLPAAQKPEQNPRSFSLITSHVQV